MKTTLRPASATKVAANAFLAVLLVLRLLGPRREAPVTAAVTGDGTYDFALMSLDSNSIYCSSKEGAHPPVLVLTVGTILAALGEHQQDLSRRDGAAERPPAQFALRAYPNPSPGRMIFAYAAPHAATARLVIYDVRGRVVHHSSQTLAGPGYGQLEWDGRDARGRAAGSGIYFYRFELDRERRTGKVLLQR